MAMRIGKTTLVSQVTGTGSVSETDRRFGVNGTDLGIMWSAPTPQHPNRTLVIFGDTFGAGWAPRSTGVHGRYWRRNVLAASYGTDPSVGLTLDAVVTGSEQDGEDWAESVATQVIRSWPRPFEITVIPHSGIMVDNRQLVHYMSVMHWGKRVWHTTHAGIAVADVDGVEWSRPGSGRWWNLTGRDRCQGGAFTRDDDWIYLVCTTQGRWGPAFLARSAPADAHLAESYEFYTGSGWASDQQRAVPVLSGDVGEVWVGRHETYGWLALHLHLPSDGIVLRSAPEITGPWTDGVRLTSGAEYPGGYGGYVYPGSLTGDDLYWTLSQWNPYQVYWMKTRLG